MRRFAKRQTRTVVNREGDLFQRRLHRRPAANRSAQNDKIFRLEAPPQFLEALQQLLASGIFRIPLDDQHDLALEITDARLTSAKMVRDVDVLPLRRLDGEEKQRNHD